MAFIKEIRKGTRGIVRPIGIEVGNLSDIVKMFGVAKETYPSLMMEEVAIVKTVGGYYHGTWGIEFPVSGDMPDGWREADLPTDPPSDNDFIKEFRPTLNRHCFVPIGRVRSLGSGRSMQKFRRMVEVAQSAFPALEERNVLIFEFGGDKYDGSVGIQFHAPIDKVPDGWTQII